MLLFTAQRRTEPPVEPTGIARTVPALQLRAMLPLLTTFLCTGAVFGSMEVATIAFADELGQQAAAGAVLACQAAGSAAAGLALGTLRPPTQQLHRRLALCVCVMAVLALLPPAAAATGTLAVLAVALLVAGMGTAPTMVTGMTLIQETVPAARLNEGMTWAVTALLCGIATGSAAGGWAAEHLPVPAAFAVPPVAAVLAAATASSASLWKTSRTNASKTTDSPHSPASVG
jgi:MFS family permease